MGTRNITMVIDKEGDVKVGQYGQWDGYPSGQGLTILDFLSNTDLNEFQEKLSKCKFLTEEEVEKINDDDWENNYPQLSRNVGGEILGHIMDSDGLELIDKSEFVDDELVC